MKAMERYLLFFFSLLCAVHSYAITGPVTDSDGNFTLTFDATPASHRAHRIEEFKNNVRTRIFYNGLTDGVLEVSTNTNGSYRYDYWTRPTHCSGGECEDFEARRGSHTVVVSIQNLPPPMTAPTVAATQASRLFPISWADSADSTVTGYELQRMTGNIWSTVYTGTKLAFNDVVQADGIYKYHLRALNPQGAGEYSASTQTQVQAQAADIDSGYYAVYEKAVAGGAKDIFIVSKETVLILHGEIATPIVFMPDLVGYKIRINNNGSIGAVTSFGLNANDLNADNTYSLSNYKLFSGDINADGQADLLLQGTGDNPSLVLTDNGTPSIYYNFGNSLDHSVVSVYVSNYGGNSAADIVVTENNGYRFAYISTGSSSTGIFTSTAEDTPASVDSPGDKPVVGQSHIDTSTEIGTTSGAFRVDESGSATYNIPIAAAPGVAGVTPQISLNYSSQAGNGVVGKGWSIGGLSSISRCRQTLHQDNQARPIAFDNTDRFCLDGQRLIVVSGIYGESGSTYKTEIDSFATVTAVGGTSGHPDSFKVERKDGSTSYYGANSSSNSKLAGSNASISTTTLTWAINRFTDSMGNAIDYLYYNDSSGQRLSQIRYAYSNTVSDGASNAGSYQANLVFSYESRSSNPNASTHIDDINAYVGGYFFTTKRRLSGIESRNAGSAIRHYSLKYKQSNADALIALSRLESITECANGYCLPATEFAWMSPQEPTTTEITYIENGIDYTVTQTSSGYGYEATANSSINTNPGGDKGVTATQFADINGDGMNDVVWVERNYNGTGTDIQSRSIKYALANGAGFEATPTSITITNTNLLNEYQLHVIDYNADGRSDILLQRLGNQNLQLFLSEPQGAAWGLSSVPIDLNIPSLVSLAVIDMDSDGLADLVYGDNNTVKVHYLKHSDQGVSSASYYRYGAPVILYTAPSDVDLGLPDVSVSSGAPDFNGDGRVDVLLTFIYQLGPQGPFPRHMKAMVTTNQGLVPMGTVFPGGVEAIPIDLNGDGLSDVISREQTNKTWHFALSTGTQLESSQLLVAESDVTREDDLNRIQVFDYNHDGYPDVVWRNSALNKVQYKLWQPSINNFGVISEEQTINGNVDGSHLFIDFNGDSNTDYIRITPGSLTTYPSKGSGEPRHVIGKITNGLGAETTIAYGSLSTGGHYERLTVGTSTTTQAFCHTTPNNNQYCGTYPLVVPDKNSFYSTLNGPWMLPEFSQTLGRDVNGDGEDDPVLELNGPIYVVHGVKSSAPVAQATSATSSISYYYAEAKIQASGRGLLGFERLKTIDNQTGVATTTYYRQDFPFIGYPLRTEVRRPNGTAEGLLISESNNTWELQGWNGSGLPPAAPYRPYLRTSVEKQNDLETGNLLSEITTDSIYENPYGNVDEITVTTTGDGQTYSTQTVNTYDPSLWGQMKGRLTKTEVTKSRNGIDVPKRTSAFTYYSEPEGGLLKTEIIEPDNTLYELTTTYIYDGFGNKTTATQSGTGVTSRAVTWHYDANNRYLIKAENADGQVTEEIVARNALGQPITVKDINGVTTTLEYDAFGSAYLEYNETGAYTVTLKAEASTDCPAGSVFMQQQQAAGGATSATCFDVLARSVRDVKTGFAGEKIYQDTEYDALGRVSKTSLPYFSYNSLGVDDWTTNHYDRLGRVTQVTLPDTTTVVTDYQERTTVTTNALSQNHTETKNALGELVSTQDHLGTQVVYTYHPNGDLHKTQVIGTNYATGISSGTDPMVTTLTYDLLGRKKTMDDPDKGNWQYTRYNVFGELEEQIDAKGQKVVMVYDRLGRMTQRTDYTVLGVVEEVTDWDYDTTPAGNGQLEVVTANTSGHSTVYTYDDFGRVELMNTILGVDGSYTESTTYDA